MMPHFPFRKCNHAVKTRYPSLKGAIFTTKNIGNCRCISSYQQCPHQATFYPNNNKFTSLLPITITPTQKSHFSTTTTLTSSLQQDDHPHKTTLLAPNKAFQHYLQEHNSSLSKNVQKLLDRIETLQQQFNTNEAFLQDPNEDEEIKEIAKEEIKAVKGEIELLEDSLCRTVILDNLQEDQEVDGVILELKPAAGGDEAALFAADLLEMYEKLARKTHWKWTVAHINTGNSVDSATKAIKSATIQINGHGSRSSEVWDTLRHESGVHRVQRVPKTETQGRVHTSTVTVAVIPQFEKVDIKVNPKDLRIDTFRAQGAGGQHVNKTDSAVRIVHIPTGIQAECQAERSQGRNKEAAMKTLLSRLYEHESKANHEKQNVFKAKRGRGDRSEKIRTYNYPQQRVTDHRLQESITDFGAFMQGNWNEELGHKLAEHEIVSTFHDIFPSDAIFEHMQKSNKKRKKNK